MSGYLAYPPVCLCRAGTHRDLSGADRHTSEHVGYVFGFSILSEVQSQHACTDELLKLTAEYQ